jgi:hypothetical protein
VWTAIILQFLILYTLTPAFGVFTSSLSYAANRANSLAVAIRLLMPAGFVAASLLGLWRRRPWGWILAALVDSAMCAQALWPPSEFDLPVFWKFAALVVLLQRPVRTHFFGQKSRLGSATPWPRVAAGASHFAKQINSRSTQLSSRMSSRVKRVMVVAIFCFAGFLSAGLFISYPAWAYLTKYDNREWIALFLGFPVGITLALLISIGTGLLPRTLVPRMPRALSLVYVGSFLTWASFILFLAFLWILSFIPAFIVFAYFLSLSAKSLTSRWPWKLFHAVWISSIICAPTWLGISALLVPRVPWLGAGYLLIPMEMTWAGMYGKVLIDSAAFSEANPPSTVGTQKKLG